MLRNADPALLLCAAGLVVLDWTLDAMRIYGAGQSCRRKTFTKVHVVSNMDKLFWVRHNADAERGRPLSDIPFVQERDLRRQVDCYHACADAPNIVPGAGRPTFPLLRTLRY